MNDDVFRRAIAESQALSATTRPTNCSAFERRTFNPVILLMTVAFIVAGRTSMRTATR